MDFYTGAMVDQVGLALLHSIWQFLVIGLITFSILQFLGNATAASRYSILGFALSLVVIAPFATWLVLPGRDASVEMTYSYLPDGLPKRDEPRPDAPVVVQSTPLVANISNASEFTEFRPSISDGSVSPGSVQHSAIQPLVLANWLPVIVRAWCCGVLLFSVRLLFGWYTVGKLRSVGTASVNDKLLGLLKCLQKKMCIRSHVDLLESKRVSSPAVVGMFRSVILLPLGFASGLPTAQLEAILAHELAHVRRVDYLTNVGQTIVETLFFYHPVVWWLSYRMRIERENCCDDVVVDVLNDRVQYGRALLAVEEHREIVGGFAMGINDGSLASRVRRLFTVTPEQRRGASVSGFVSLCCAGALILAMNYSLSGDEQRSSEDVWGEVSHGLRIRILSDTNEVKTSHDISLTVEVENVSDEPISLLGLGDDSGVNPATEYTPHAFRLDVYQQNGKLLPRTERGLFHAWHLVRNGSVRTLQAGDSAKLEIQPGKFRRPVNYELPAGHYKLRVRYRGPNQKLLNEAAKHIKDEALPHVWSHEVVSNPLAIRIAKDLREPAQLVWGEEVDGLVAAVELRTHAEVGCNPHRAPGVPLGTGVAAVFHLKNVTDKPISLVSETGRQGDTIQVTNQRGEDVPIKSTFYTGWPIDVAWTIQPGEIAQLDVLSPSIDPMWEAGQYKVRCSIRFNSRVSRDDDGNRTFPRPGDYFSVIDTGEASLFVSDYESVGKEPSKTDVDSVPSTDARIDPFRLPDHWIVEDLQWVNDDKELVTISLQGGVNVRRWNVDSRELLSEIKLRSDKHGRIAKQGTLKLSADGKCAFAVTDEYVGVWDAKSGELHRRLAIPRKEWEYGTVSCLACNADGSIVVAGLTTSFSRSTMVYSGYGIAWNANTGQEICRFEHKNGMDVCGVSVTPDGELFASCTSGHHVGIWETKSGRLVHDLSKFAYDWHSPEESLIQNNVVRNVKLSPTGKVLAISGTFGIKLVDAGSGHLRTKIDAPYSINFGAIEFSADGRRFARFGPRRTRQSPSIVHLWLTESGRKLGELTTKAKQVRFSSDARRIAVADSDFNEAVSIWPTPLDKTLGPMLEPEKPHRIDRVEENTHGSGHYAAKFAERWKPIWGKAQGGLQYGLAFTSAPDSNQTAKFSAGVRIPMVAFVRNTSNRSIQIDFRPDMFGNSPRIESLQRDPVLLGKHKHLGRVAHYRDVLQAGEVFGPLYLNVGVGQNPLPNRQVWTPYWLSPKAGAYSIVHSVSIGAREPQASPDVAKPDWNPVKLTSGTLEFDIAL